MKLALVSCRLVSIVAALGALGGCNKDAPAPAADPPTPKRTPETAAAPAPSPTPAPPPRDEVTPTGVLDLELATTGGRFVLRNPTFEVAFPARPTVQAQDDTAPVGIVVTSALAFVSQGSDQFAFAVSPMPRPYDPEVGLRGARDGAIQNVGGTLVSEVDATLGGIPSKHVRATARQGGQTLYIDLHLAWDAAHYQLVTLLTAAPRATPSTAATAFVRSFVVKP